MFYSGVKPAIVTHNDVGGSYIVPSGMYALIIADPMLNAPVQINGSNVAESKLSIVSGSVTSGSPVTENEPSGISGTVTISITVGTPFTGGAISVNGVSWKSGLTSAQTYELRVSSGWSIGFSVSSGQINYEIEYLAQDFGNGNDRIKRATASQNIEGPCTIFSYYLP